MTDGNDPALTGAETPAPASAETPAQPRPVAEVDDKLLPLVREFHRVRWIRVALALVVLFIAVIILTVISAGNRNQLTAARAQIAVQQQQLVIQNRELAASCQWWRSLAPLPVQAVAPGRPPTRLGVELIAGARVAFQGQRCGLLPPADPSLLRWAAYYKVPVP